MTHRLALDEEVNTHECTKIIMCMAKSVAGSLPWQCKHINFLVAKSKLPGSGIASILSCNLSTFPWYNLLQKEDLNLETVEAIVSLNGSISHYALHKCFMKYVYEDTAVLLFAIKNTTPNLSDYDIIMLHEKAVNWNNLKFAEQLLLASNFDTLIHQALELDSLEIVENLVSKGAYVDPTVLIKKMGKADLYSRKYLVTYVLSSSDACAVNELILKAIEYSDFQLAECLLEKRGEVIQSINFCSLLELFKKQDTIERKMKFVTITENVLKSGVDPNRRDGSKVPLDIILEISQDCHAKICLLMLLLQHGANIENSKYAKEKGTTIIHIATKLAINSGKSSINFIDVKMFKLFMTF